MIELGKSGKYMGVQHPRDARKIDREPPKPSQKASGQRRPRKRYGFTYQRRLKASWLSTGKPGKWHKITHWSYYATEKQRDQAMRDTFKGDTYHEVRNCKPVTRP